jgi:hypothetical protein
MSVCLSVRIKRTRFPLDGFSWNFSILPTWRIFMKFQYFSHLTDFHEISVFSHLTDFHEISVFFPHLTDFHEISVFFPSKICRENSSFIKIWQM